MGGTFAVENEINKRVIKTLGLKEADIAPLGSEGDVSAFDTFIRKGIPYTAIRIVGTALKISESAFAAYLGMSLRTLQRKRVSHARLSISEGDRLFRIARIFALAATVLESEEMAQRWLHREQRGLGGRIPIQVIQTEAGAREVEDLLEKIEYGVLI